MPLDGTAANYGQSGSSIAATLTTTLAGKIFAVVSFNPSATVVTSITASGLTFTKKAENLGDFHYLSFWEADSSGPQTALSITANLDASSTFITLHTWGYSGTLVLDSHASNPNVGGTDPRTISTQALNTVVFHVEKDSTAANPSAGTGFTEILGATGSGFMMSQYQVFTASQTNLACHDNGAVDSANAAIAIAYWLADLPAPATKITFVNAGAQTASNASPQAPALPTNHAAGDLLLLFCIQSSASGITFGPPAGWVSIGRNSNATRSMTIEVFAKIDNGSESAPSTTCSSAAGGWATQIGCWRNVDDGVISDATAVLSDAAAAATFQPTGITINTVNAWVISFVGSKDDNALNFNTANGYTARMSGASYDDTAGNGSDYSVGVADQEFTTTGAKTCPTWNQSVNGNDAWVALTLALRPKTLVWGGRPDGAIGGFQMMQLLAL